MNLMLGDVQIMCPRAAGPDTAHQPIVADFDDLADLEQKGPNGDGGFRVGVR
jgi:hypothetical protein